MRLFVDTPDTLESREFFGSFKEQLKARFRQLGMWLTTYPVEVL